VIYRAHVRIVLQPLLPEKCLDRWLTERIGAGGAPPPAKFRHVVLTPEPPYVELGAKR
jgi:hypothetical protein